MPLRLVPDDTRIPFMRYQYVGYAISAALILLTVVLLPIRGLSFGIDFQGGILIEVGMPGEAADLAAMRSTLGGLAPDQLARNPTYSRISEYIPGGGPEGHAGFIGQAFGSVQGWMSDFVSSLA